MLRFFVSRFFQAGISLWVLITLTFILLRFFPGSPFDEEVELHSSVREQVELYYGVHQSFSQQYLHYLLNLTHGHLGVSQVFSGKDVSDIISEAMPTTLRLTFLSMSLAMAIALILAFLGASSRWGEYLMQMVSLVGISLPTLFLGPLIIYLFGFYWGLLPVALLEGPLSYILPVVVMAIRPASAVGRILFSSMKSTRASDDLRTARSFGVPEWRITLKYNLRKSIIPALSYLLGTTGTLMGGALIVEILFALPGLGSRFLDAVLNRDATLVMGLTLSYGFFIFLFQVVSDVLMMILDPRVRST